MLINFIFFLTAAEQNFFLNRIKSAVSVASEALDSAADLAHQIKNAALVTIESTDNVRVMQDLWAVQAASTQNELIDNIGRTSCTGVPVKVAQGFVDVDCSPEKYIEFQKLFCTQIGQCVGEQAFPDLIVWANPKKIILRTVLAAGSMARIYTGEYEGQQIAVKVAHPEVGGKVNAAISYIDFGNGAAREKTGMCNAKNSIREVSSVFRDEPDLSTDIANLKVIQQALSLSKRIRVPSYYDNLSDAKHLVMELEQGEDLFNFVDPKKKSAEQRQEVAILFLEVLFTLLSHNIWYLDANPGCGKISADINGKLIFTLLDFGACRILLPEQSQAIISFILNQDTQSLTELIWAFEGVCPYNRSQLELLRQLFTLYIHPLKYDACMSFERYRENVKKDQFVVIKRVEEGNVSAPSFALVLMKWFDQISQMMFRLGVSLNFHQVILSVTTPTPAEPRQ